MPEDLHAISMNLLSYKVHSEDCLLCAKEISKNILDSFSNKSSYDLHQRVKIMISVPELGGKHPKKTPRQGKWKDWKEK